MPNQTKFERRARRRIIEALRNGAFLASAAAAAGIDRGTLREWLTSTDPKYAIQRRVEMAQGSARAGAETSVHVTDKKFWLLCGPGRERFDEDGRLVPGWSRGGATPPKINIFLTAAWRTAQQAILDAIADHPDLRAKIADIMVTLEARNQAVQTPVLQIETARPDDAATPITEPPSAAPEVATG